MTKTLLHAPFALEGADANGWLHIVPRGPFVLARDGRSFQVSDPAAVVARSELPLLLDVEHSSEQPWGSTEAVAWCEQLEVRDGGIFARTEFTPKGLELVKSKSYRFLSPVLLIDSETRDVQEIVSVALTNKPALRMEKIDSAAFAQRSDALRMACSMHVAERSGLTGKQRAKLLESMSAAELARAERFVAERRATAQPELAEVRDDFVARGGTAAEFHAVQAFRAAQAAAFREE